MNLMMVAAQVKDLDAINVIKSYSGVGFGDCLHHAVLQNDIDAVKWLLEAGANPNAKGSSCLFSHDAFAGEGGAPTFWFPLTLAALKGHYEIFRLLSGKGATMGYGTQEENSMNKRYLQEKENPD
jgi:hypothetical protein